MINKKKKSAVRKVQLGGARQRVVRLNDIKKAKIRQKNKADINQEQKRRVILWIAVSLVMIFIVASWGFMVKRNIDYLTKSQDQSQEVNLEQFKADWQKDLDKLKEKLTNLSQEIQEAKQATSSTATSSTQKQAFTTATSSATNASSIQVSSTSQETLDSLKAKIDELEKKLEGK